MSKANTQRFSSRMALILSMLGIAIGTGNIWRFPRITALNGGDDGAGGFLIAWTVFLLIWSVPLIVAEYALGRKTRLGVVGAFVSIAGERFAWAGGFVGLVATAIMFYYSVVTGWCFYYFFQTALGSLPADLAAATSVWETFQSGPLPILFHALAMGLSGFVIWKGVSRIERVTMVLMPALFIVILLCLIRALTLPGAGEGLRYLFTPDWQTMKQPGVWLDALTQNAWDTGAGWGLVLTYGAYMQHKHHVVKNALTTGVGNNLISIVAAVIIFGTVFAILGSDMPQKEVLRIMKDSGPGSTGLTFIWTPQLFAHMPFGRTLGVLFFLGLAFAAFASLISMVELAARILVDFGISRSRSVAFVSTGGFLLGVPSALSLDFLGNQDFVWGVALMISGALIAWIIIRYGVSRFRAEAVDVVEGDWRAGRGWDFLMRYLVPLQAIVLLAWWLYLSATALAPDTWFNPLDPYSIMTCVVQWALAAGFLVWANRWMVKKMSMITGVEVSGRPFVP